MTHSTSKESSAQNRGLLGRLGAKLGATRQSLTRGLGDILLGKREIDDELLEELEDLLVTADVGVEVSNDIIDDITEGLKRKQLTDASAVYPMLREHLLELLRPCAQPLHIDKQAKPYVIMVVGVNGVGKTTTIGKLGLHLKQDGQQLMLAAADTFRAAAVEQLQSWGERNAIPVIAQQSGADAAAVAHDALQAARARASDILIVDTAGRQHTHDDLMQELQKIKRVLQKLDADAPHEVLMVLDAGNGQNALSQLEHFHRAVGVTGLCLTKLDGTAKGGILIAIAKKSGLPIRYIGVGEGVEDLRRFDADEFIEALLPKSM